MYELDIYSHIYIRYAGMFGELLDFEDHDNLRAADDIVQELIAETQLIKFTTRPFYGLIFA